RLAALGGQADLGPAVGRMGTLYPGRPECCLFCRVRHRPRSPVRPLACATQRLGGRAGLAADSMGLVARLCRARRPLPDRPVCSPALEPESGIFPPPAKRPVHRLPRFALELYAAVLFPPVGPGAAGFLRTL